MQRYTIIIYTPQELNHSSYIQTGLFEIENLGCVDLQIRLCTSKLLGRFVIENNTLKKLSKQAYPKVSYYKLVDNNTQQSISFATDLYDFANQFSIAALENCDYVFKRNFETQFVNKLPEKYQSKISPLGITFGVHSEFKRKDFLFFTGLLLSNLKVNVKLDRNIFKRVRHTCKKQIRHWDFIKTSRKIERFVDFQNPSENIIFFQTRCFLYDIDKDVINIHGQRYRIIKLLRNAFPDKFLGGFIPSKIAIDKYADAISNVPSEPELYLDALKKSKIVIYTRGLVNSPAWKMAEYLSQGKIIIAERLTAELPVPLVHGKELLYFNTDKELIANINLVLADEEFGNTLAANARTYFEQHVHPVKSIKRILGVMSPQFEKII